MGNKIADPNLKAAELILITNPLFFTNQTFNATNEVCIKLVVAPIEITRMYMRRN